MDISICWGVVAESEKQKMRRKRAAVRKVLVEYFTIEDIRVMTT